MGRPFLSFLLELTATGVILYISANPDVNWLALFWRTVYRGALDAAERLGRFGMRAEVRYWQVVKL